MLNLEKKIVFCGALMVVFQLLFPQYSLAQTNPKIDFKKPAAEASLLAIANSPQPIIYEKHDLSAEHRLPMATERKPRVIKTFVTAYSSTVDQCDGDPFTTANGWKVKDGIIAANSLPFGAKVRLPQVFGDKVFTVADRMNPKYDKHFDVWMETREQAIKFGGRYVEVEIF